MRILVLLATVSALIVAGCGDDENPTETTVNQSTALPLTVERSGGVAGIRDKLVVRADGTGTVVSRDGATRKLTAEETRAVRSALRELVFAGLHDEYGPPEGVGVADGIDYAFTAGGDTIVVKEMAEDVPEPLLTLKAA